ncbi:MAG: DNA-binding response regulator [Rhizobiales bacterium PAR1]|nr:MAG: DNA-binding response regulator [Rhizobiales bacterium PAR1]
MSLAPHILLVEDDREIRHLMTRLLRSNGYRVSEAGDGRMMDDVLSAARIDLVVLDIMLPGEDGFSLCRRLQASALPIILVSAKGDDIDRVLGLELGADDYVVKPFNPRELLARVKAVLRRSGAQRLEDEKEEPVEFRFRGWRMDMIHRRLFDPAGVLIAVTDAEFDLLQVFCARPRRLLSRDQLIDLTQGRAAHPTERSIDILVARIRRKMIHDSLDGDFIRTVRSGGYMFTLEVDGRETLP